MSQENIDVVRAVFEAGIVATPMRPSGMSATTSSCTSSAASQKSWERSGKGRDGLLRFWRDWLGTIGGQLALESTLERAIESW
jgi:hypothetical protein